MKRIGLGILFGVVFAFVSMFLLVNTTQVAGGHAEQESFVRLLGSKPLLAYAAISALAFILLAAWLNRVETRGWREVIKSKHSPIMIRTEHLMRYGRSPSDVHRVTVAKALFGLMSHLNAIGFVVGGFFGMGLVAMVLPRLFTRSTIPGEWFKYFLGFGSGALVGSTLAGLGSSHWKIGQFLMFARYAGAKPMMLESVEEEWWVEVARWMEDQSDQGYE